MGLQGIKMDDNLERTLMFLSLLMLWQVLSKASHCAWLLYPFLYLTMSNKMPLKFKHI